MAATTRLRATATTPLLLLVLLVWSAALLLVPASATSIASAASSDGEDIVIEDISHELEAYGGGRGKAHTHSNYNDGGDAETRTPGGGGGGRRRSQTAQQNSRKGGKSGGSSSTAAVLIPMEKLVATVAQIEREEEQLEAELNGMKDRLVAGETVESVSTRLTDLHGLVSRAWASSHRYAQNDTTNTFAPLEDKLLKRHSPKVGQLKHLLEEQLRLHADLMKSTESLLPLANKTHSTPVLRSTIRKNLKKNLPASKDAIESMVALQQAVRRQRLRTKLGLAPRELRQLFLIAAAPPVVALLLELVAVRRRWLPATGGHWLVSLLLTFVPIMAAYHAVVVPVLPFLAPHQIAVQLVALVATAVCTYRAKRKVDRRLLGNPSGGKKQQLGGGRRLGNR